MVGNAFPFTNYDLKQKLFRKRQMGKSAESGQLGCQAMKNFDLVSVKTVRARISLALVFQPQRSIHWHLTIR